MYQKTSVIDMAATLANKAYARTGSFYIDFGINKASIPHFSFADLLTNRFDPKLVRGRNILIGGTALELGDEFAVPVHGIASGVFLHALSYESIYQNRTLVRPSTFLSLLVALLVIAMLDWQSTKSSWLTISLRHCAVLMIGAGAPLIIQHIWPVSIDASPILLTQFLCLGKVFVLELERRAQEIFRQRALNLRQQALVTFAVKDSSDGIIVTDSLGRIELCNERASTLFAIKDPAKAIGLSLVEIVPGFPTYPVEPAPSGEERLVPADCFPVVQDYKVADCDLEVSGDWTIAENTHFENVKGCHIFVYTIRDISVRMRIAEKERKVTDTLVAALAAKTHFIHNMGHELRTPLNAVIGFSDLICSETAGPVGNPAYVEYAGYIRDGGKRLLDVVNDVLEVTRLESGNVNLQLERIDLAQLIEHAHEHAANVEYGVKHLNLKLSPGIPPVLVDRWFFTEALRHVLANSMKFTSEGGRIDVIVQSCPRGDVTIEIRDDGIGVDPKHLIHLTEAFYQADPSLSRKHEGTGLGLFLTYKYLALHDARLELESDAGRGFTARIVLPNQAEERAGAFEQAVA